MKTAKSNREEVRANNLSIPMTKEEKDAVRSASAKCGLTMTSWARMVLAEKINQK
jgi:hypothetical protein